MNYRIVGRIISMIMLLEAVFMVMPLGISFYDREIVAAHGFLNAMGVLAVLGVLLFLLTRRCEKKFYAQEGFVATALSWIALSVFGALPFWLSGEIPHFVDALFEIVSGFTTTGASILADVEALSRGMLFWRSFSHWVGGMGVLVFMLAVVPAARKTAGSDMHLLRAESPGPSVGKLTPQLRTTAISLYLMYIALTVVCAVCLLISGMPLFDTLCITFGTAGTGGFGTLNASCAAYTYAQQSIVTIFMFLFGVNFSLYYLVLIGQWKEALKDEELRFYAAMTIGSVLLIALNILPQFDHFGDALHHAAFQVSSIVTTTGFSTIDFEMWPAFSKGIMLLLMALGASAGSTGGGLKMIRALILLKGIRKELHYMLRPRRVQHVQINKRVVDGSVIKGVHTYLAAYCVLAFGSFLLISIDGFSIGTNLSAVLACFNNIGPGFEMVGATQNYSIYSVFSKLVLTFDMLLGRLEIFPLLVLFSRYTWSRRR